MTGNTIFSWPVAPKMRCGSSEDDQSSTNVITGNNVNYYEKADVLSQGRDSVVGHNAGYGELPHQNPESIGRSVQSFRIEATQKLIDEMMG